MSMLAEGDYAPDDAIAATASLASCWLPEWLTTTVPVLPQAFSNSPSNTHDAPVLSNFSSKMPYS